MVSGARPVRPRSRLSNDDDYTPGVRRIGRSFASKLILSREPARQFYEESRYVIDFHGEPLSWYSPVSP